MSHFTKVQTVIRDQELLEETLRQLNYQFQTGERLHIQSYQTRSKYGQIVINTGSNYDIGFQLQADQTFTVYADWWGVQRNTAIREEEFVNAVNRTYAHLAIKKQALEQGLIIEEEIVLPNGEIELVVCEPY